MVLSHPIQLPSRYKILIWLFSKIFGIEKAEYWKIFSCQYVNHIVVSVVSDNQCSNSFQTVS